MKSIAQELEFHQRLMKYLEHHGVIETANRYHVSRKTIWKYRKRWDGTAASLAEQSRRPHHFPHAQTEEVRVLVRRMRKNTGKIFYRDIRKRRRRAIHTVMGCFKRTPRQEVPEKVKKHIRKNKPYERAKYPGRKVQVDVKYIPHHCVVDGRSYYVYCAKDECSRWMYCEMFD